MYLGDSGFLRYVYFVFSVAAAAEVPESPYLYVGNLPAGCSDAEVHQLFVECGTLKRLIVKGLYAHVVSCSHTVNSRKYRTCLLITIFVG